jgi:hypothetical protein
MVNDLPKKDQRGSTQQSSQGIKPAVKTAANLERFEDAGNIKRQDKSLAETGIKRQQNPKHKNSAVRKKKLQVVHESVIEINNNFAKLLKK